MTAAFRENSLVFYVQHPFLRSTRSGARKITTDSAARLFGYRVRVLLYSVLSSSGLNWFCVRLRFHRSVVDIPYGKWGKPLNRTIRRVPYNGNISRDNRSYTRNKTDAYMVKYWNNAGHSEKRVTSLRWTCLVFSSFRLNRLRHKM